NWFPLSSCPSHRRRHHLGGTQTKPTSSAALWPQQLVQLGFPLETNPRRAVPSHVSRFANIVREAGEGLERVENRRGDRKRFFPNGDDPHETAAAIALPTFCVFALPPMSAVRGPSRRTTSIAFTIESPASLCPR